MCDYLSSRPDWLSVTHTRSPWMLRCTLHPSRSTCMRTRACTEMRGPWQGPITPQHQPQSCRWRGKRPIEELDKWRQHCLDGRCRDCDRVSVAALLAHSVGYGTSLNGVWVETETGSERLCSRHIFKLDYQSRKWKSERPVTESVLRLTLLRLEGLQFSFLLSDLAPNCSCTSFSNNNTKKKKKETN